MMRFEQERWARSSGAGLFEQDLTAAWGDASRRVHLPGELQVESRSVQPLLRCVLRSRVESAQNFGEKIMTDITVYSCTISVQTKKMEGAAGAMLKTLGEK